MEERLPGRIERTAVAMLDKIPNFFLYAPVVLIIAWLLAVSGRGELTLKSYGLLALAIWLAVDLWNWILRKRWRWKIVVGWTGTNLLLIGTMWIMCWWLDGKLKDQQEDVRQHLVSQVVSSATDDPRRSAFTVINGGNTGIGHHEIYCTVNAEKFEEGVFTKGNTMRRQMVSSDLLLAPGDQESTQCLLVLGSRFPLLCADATLEIWYSLETQPSIRQNKEFRFVGNGKGREFQWTGQPISTPGNFCGI